MTSLMVIVTQVSQVTVIATAMTIKLRLMENPWSTRKLRKPRRLILPRKMIQTLATQAAVTLTKKATVMMIKPNQRNLWPTKNLLHKGFKKRVDYSQTEKVKAFSQTF